jgi:hypothetical protein
MNRWFQTATIGALAALLAALGSGQALAQYPPYGGAGNPNSGPSVSPYLLLNRPGNSAGVNYYGLVKPQQDFRNAFRGIQQQFGAQQAQQATDPRTGLPNTGHVAMFLNTGGYFLNMSPGMGGMAGGFGAGMAGRQGAGAGMVGRQMPTSGGVRGMPGLVR